jgi:hypothetical protein
MNQTFLLPMARNTRTGETVKTQDLTGTRYTHQQRTIAQEVADQLAAKMTARTAVAWQGFLQTYTPTHRR